MPEVARLRWPGLGTREEDIVRKLRFVAFLAGVAFSPPMWAQESDIEAAKQLFAQFVALENAHNAGLADLYADEAFIKTRRSMPMGEPQEITVPAAKYKTLLRQNMPMAEARGDRNTYADVTYAPEGSFVRIDARRISEQGKSTTPISLLVGPSRGGKWLIYEELSESRQ